MGMKFPIESMDAKDIPEFSQIFDEFSSIVPDLSNMLAFLCYRFDPGCAEVRRMVSVTEKDRVASDKAMWRPPEPVVITDPDTNEQTLDEWYVRYCEVQGAFFRCLDNDDWEFIVSLDIAIHNANMVIREPLPTSMDPEKKGKAILNIQKAIEGNKDALETRRQIARTLADGDDNAAKAILSSTKSSRASMSPEGHLRHG